MGLPSFTTQLNVASCINWSFLSMNLSAVTLTVFDLLVLPWIHALRRLPNKLTLVSKMIQNPTQPHKFPSVMPIPLTIIRSTKNAEKKSWSPLSQDSIVVCFWGLRPHPRLSSMSWGIALRGGPSCPPQVIQWDDGKGWLSPKPLSPTDPPSLMSVFNTYYQLFVLEFYS